MTLFWSAKQQDGASLVKDFGNEIKCVVLYEFLNGTCYLSGYINGDGTDFWKLKLPVDNYYKYTKANSNKIGTPIGDVLYSDITAYINDCAIPTSIINGKTLVVVEDLARYGFDVIWDKSEKTLKIERNKDKKIEPLTVTKDTINKPGTFKQKYVYTDIKTYLSGEIVESYAIDGRTLIDFELLAKYGKLTWDDKTREIRLVIEDK